MPPENSPVTLHELLGKPSILLRMEPEELATRGPLDPARRAVHEAAHAAVAFLVGIGIEYVSIDRVWMNGQWCEGGVPATNATKAAMAADPNRWLDPFAQFMMAGIAMDQLLLAAAEQDVSRRQRDCWGGDYATLAEIANDLRDFSTFGEYTAWRDRRTAEARQLLGNAKTLAGLNAVAALLVELGRISEEVARTVFFRAVEVCR